MKRCLVGICPACLNYRRLTTHHLWPKRVYGRRGNDATITLCSKCHEALERVMPYRPTMEQCLNVLFRILGFPNVRG